MLAKKLYELTSFQNQYEALQILSVCDLILELDWEHDRDELYDRIDWNNILGIASGLAFSDQNEHLDAALRIAQTVLQNPLLEEYQKNAAGAILISLTNNPAIELAVDREFISRDFQDKLPLSIKLQNNKLKFENSIVLNEKILQLNKFQNDVFKSSESYDAISVSAPTSAGKSFILCSIIIDELIKGKKNIIYIVPTRALISQVENDLRELFDKYELEVNISTVPTYFSDMESAISNVFIFTQERLHWFLTDNNHVDIDIAVIDEAHKIEDGHRGILLQQKLENLFEENPKVKIFFSSPFTSNPELLLQTVDDNVSKKSIITQFVSVNQNLIYVSQYPRNTTKWILELCLPDKIIKLGVLNLRDRPTNEKKKISFITSQFSVGDSGNLIYANGPFEAEEISLTLYECIENKVNSECINDLISLVKKTVHNDYRLAKVLEKGIAFHYGNMPLLIRQEIERLFKIGEIKYLICTSTLLEGVNLPAKSIFIRKPRRGSTSPLNQSDFWNLAGRAGRWGKEFNGNIICIEPLKWDIPPNPNKTKQKIVRALDVVSEKHNELIEYIENKSPREEAEKRQDLEFAFGYYYNLFIDNKLLPDDNLRIALIDIFESIKSEIKIPNEILKRNSGISPIAQQKLLDHFYEKINDVENLVPVYPEDENAYNEYISLIGRIGKTISFYPYQLNASRAVLILNWISGKPLSYIIKASYSSYQRSPKYKNKIIHTVIREVMESVENFARFRFAKDSSCYVDILRYFLNQIKREDLLSNIPELNLWLEFGVSQKTHLSLLSLGLTRNTVVELANYISSSNMNKSEALAWLQEQDLTQYEFSPVILEDIKSKI